VQQSDRAFMGGVRNARWVVVSQDKGVGAGGDGKAEHRG
jgi:hypothetical protein